MFVAADESLQAAVKLLAQVMPRATTRSARESLQFTIALEIWKVIFSASYVVNIREKRAARSVAQVTKQDLTSLHQI